MAGLCNLHWATLVEALRLGFLIERELGHTLPFILYIFCPKCHVDTSRISHPSIDTAKVLIFLPHFSVESDTQRRQVTYI